MPQKQRRRPYQIRLEQPVENYNQALIFLTSEIQKAYGFFLFRAIYVLQQEHGLTNQEITRAFGFTRQNLSKLNKKYRRLLEEKC